MKVSGWRKRPNWRELGVVQDSEDEEELDVHSTNSEGVKDAHDSTFEDVQIPAQSANDSFASGESERPKYPCSLVPVFIDPRFQKPHAPDEDQESQTAAQTVSPTTPTVDDSIYLNVGSNNEAASPLPISENELLVEDGTVVLAIEPGTRRSLRQRKAIQLHPYLIENEKYRRDLRARGIRPITLQRQTHREPSPEYATDSERSSQSQNVASASLAAPEPPKSSPPLSDLLETLSPSEGGHMQARPTEDDEELPDLASLLSSRPQKFVKNGSKRRRTERTYIAKRPGPVGRIAESPQSKHRKHQSPITGVFPEGNFDILSPAMSTPTFPINEQFVQPAVGGIGPSSVILPTPATSSEANRPNAEVVETPEPPQASSTKRRIFSVLSSSDVDSPPPAHCSPSMDLTESTSGSGEDEQELQRVKRRMRGVLPASWLKLDQQTRENGGKSRFAATREKSAETSFPQPGLARKVQRRRDLERSHSPHLFDQDLERISNGPGLSPQRSISEIHLTPSPEEQVSNSGINGFDVGRRHMNPLLDLTSQSPPQATRDPAVKSFRIRQSKLKPVVGNLGTSNRRRWTRDIYLDRNDSASTSRQPFRRTTSEISEGATSSDQFSPDNTGGLVSDRSTPENDKDDLVCGYELSPVSIAGSDSFIGSSFRDPSRYASCSPTSSSRRPVRSRVSNSAGVSDVPSANNLTSLYGCRTKRQPKRPKVRQTRLNPMVKSFHDHNPNRHGTSGGYKTISKKPAESFTRAGNRELRDGQLEFPETEFDTNHRKTAFRRDLARIDTLSREGNYHDPFIGDTGSPNENPVSWSTTTRDITKPRVPPSKAFSRNVEPPAHSAPKRHAKRPSDPNASRTYRPQSNHLDHTISVADIHTNNCPAPFNEVDNFVPFALEYSSSFDIFPLDPETHFHQDSFIGSGRLHDAFTERDLDALPSFMNITIRGKAYRWGPWTDEVCSEMAEIFQIVMDSVQGTIASDPSVLGSRGSESYLSLNVALNYIASYLTFLDPIDRTSFVLSFGRLLRETGGRILGFAVGSHSQYQLRIALSLTVLSCQVLSISKHPCVDNEKRKNVEALLMDLARFLVASLNYCGFHDMRSFLHGNRSRYNGYTTIRPSNFAIDGVVTLACILQHAAVPQGSIMDLQAEIQLSLVRDATEVRQFERVWHDTFVVLPFLEIDTHGRVDVGRRFRITAENWDAIREILDRLFKFHDNQRNRRDYGLNGYIRACFSRCHRLIDNWGWHSCYGVMKTIFDFFARNRLAPLRNEESRGSPDFLDSLHRDPAVAVLAGDRAFHIFLKILASSLRASRQKLPEKQITRLVWRFIPNHGRYHPRDQDMRQVDLDAFRNHHDLLATLFWASPPPCRPRLSLFRDLVDHISSHREVCRLNIRTWTSLAKFLVSEGEGDSSLQPLADWFRDIVFGTIAQFRQARTEAEHQFEISKGQNGAQVSQTVLEAVINGNQRPALASLADALRGLGNVLKVAKRTESSTFLLENSNMVQSFKLFDGRANTATSVILEALGAISDAIDRLTRTPTESRSLKIVQDEDSQDYGEWPDITDLEFPGEEPSSPSVGMMFLHDPLYSLLSNCFGAESAPEDRLLIKSVDVWSHFAGHLINVKSKKWTDFVDPFSPSSWHELRETEHKRKYTPYFIAAMLEADVELHEGFTTFVLTSWLISLVERESLLKFQHKLTTAVLNAYPSHPILQNLPFTKDENAARYDISANDVHNRRLMTISTILSNMRRSIEGVASEKPRRLSERREQYRSLLRSLMSKMKENFGELQQHSAAQGTYVGFVQTVVQFMQQYTADICAVDKFFTDSAAFPLPADDPTYVVGKLKSYELKLQDSRSAKQLMVYLQNLSERAAIDNQQKYLVRQLHAAMVDPTGGSEFGRHALREVFLQSVLPSYAELCIESPAGWIFALPMLQASACIFDELKYDLDVANHSSVQAWLLSITVTLDVLRRAAELLIDHPGLLEQSSVLRVLWLIFEIVRAVAMPLDFFRLRNIQSEEAAQRVEFFRSFSLFAAEIVLGHGDALAPSTYGDFDNVETPYESLRQYCTQELRQAARENWVKRGDNYFVRRGNMDRRVEVDLDQSEEEQRRLIAKIEEFHGVLGQTFTFGGSVPGRFSELPLGDLFL
ncbi:Mus7/MMS22 family-domain-containing protein [Lineolata rhizophorae]|uniref:Mus7/MMS22 family-domain-containing protein n=1 Tax=Lineolata rhizophorae TaxID=578093 RepID=A0A6A6PAW7_9PEZI|nr:Mus7/MMS22 family-domain-containing protein [Lineolata rhizophorae]